MLTLSSCKIAHSLIELNRKNAKVYNYKLADKEIKFVSMHHMGKKEFYDDVKNIIAINKKDGFRVYHERVSSMFEGDSLLRDIIRRKARKIKGFSGTYKENVESSMFDKYVQQPDNIDLGIDDTDLWADVNYFQLINEWERINDVIILDSIDLHTPFNEKFNKGVFYTKKQYNKILIEYRNEHLIHLIKTNSDKKILVFYGDGHRKDFKKRLKKSGNH
jgi:hypothetical protein